MCVVRPWQWLLFAFLTMLAAIGADRAAPLFPNPMSDPGGNKVTSLAVGDFNGDGKLDAAATNYLSNDVSVMLGVGDGTFGPETRYSAGSLPARIVTADFNLDSKLDLAVLDYSGGPFYLYLLMGQGDGTFTPVPVTAPAGGSALAAGDLDNDGKVDLVLVYSGPTSSSYVKLISRGDGTFAVSSLIGTAANANSVTVADLDSDGKQDLVVGANQTVAVHRGTGLGQFANPVNYPTAFSNWSIRAADLNLDGRLDLVTVYTTSQPTPGAPDGFVHVMLARPGGGFTSGPDTLTYSYAFTAVVADLDGDGIPDVAVGGQGGLDVLRGLGNGSLSPTRFYGAGTYAIGLAAGDLNADGRVDLVTASQSSSLWGGTTPVDGVIGFLGAGDGTFGQPRIDDISGGRAVVRGDFDEDGHADIAALQPYASTPQVSIFHGNGNGTFGAVQSRAFSGSNALQMVAADFNHDGHLDVALSVNYAAVVLLGTGTGGLGPAVSYPAGETHTSIAVGDLNEDGNPDLILNNQGNDNVSTIYGMGDGTFSSNVRFTSGWHPEGMAVGDVDGDGHPDLVVGCQQTINGPSGLSILRNLGNYVFAPPVFKIWGGVMRPSVEIADLNADGHADLLAWNDSSDDVTLFLGQGGGAFDPRVALPSGDLPMTLKVADVTGDGRLDLVVSDIGSDDVAVLEGDGNGGFASRRRYATLDASSIDIGDFNEDGSPDVVVAGSVISFLLNQLRGTPGHNPLAVAGPDIVAECTSPAGAAVVLDATGSSDPDSTPGTNDDIVSYSWYEDFGTPAQHLLGSGVTIAPPLSMGVHAVTLRVVDSTGLAATDDLTVTVADTMPPILSVSVAAVLWPPNHRLVPATATVQATDLCGPVVLTALDSVTSSEPDDAPGGADGATTGDIQGASPGTPDTDFLLRAERLASGPGRVYTATYRAVDAHGNVAFRGGVTTVSHDQSGITDPVTLDVTETVQGTLLTWDAVPGAADYDVAVGDLASLRTWDESAGAFQPFCLAHSLSWTNTQGFEISEVPDPGSGFFFVVSYRVTARSGYGAESAPYDMESLVPSNICP